MPYPIRIWSKAYSPSADTDSFSIQVEKPIWEKAFQQEGSRRKFLRIEHPEGLEDWIAPLGDPVSHNHHEQKEDEIYDIFVPLWMVDTANLGGVGNESVLEIIDDTYFPEASRIVLRVIDSAFYNADVKEELERALSAMGVVREHTTLQIPVAALEGFTIEVFVSKTEPANIVLCDGEEVAVEFEEPIDQIAPPRPPTPVPQPPRMIQADQMIPTDFLGPPPPTSGFRPFQGQGHILGGSNANIPAWRRELGLPRNPNV